MSIELPHPLDERYRWCVYCGVDCWPDEPDHAVDCPTNTRCFPITEQELRFGGMRCADCCDEFKLGDTYTHRKAQDGDGRSIETAPVYVVVCPSCAVLDAEIETK